LGRDLQSYHSFL